MKLQDLLKNIQPVEIAGDVETEVTGVNIDSRKIKDSHLFVAMKGTQVDGHKFIPKAIELGAKSILCEDMPEEKVEGVTYVKVESTEDAVGKVATLFYGDPSKKLKLARRITVHTTFSFHTTIPRSIRFSAAAVSFSRRLVVMHTKYSEANDSTSVAIDRILPQMPANPSVPA